MGKHKGSAADGARRRSQGGSTSGKGTGGAKSSSGRSVRKTAAKASAGSGSKRTSAPKKPPSGRAAPTKPTGAKKKTTGKGAAGKAAARGKSAKPARGSAKPARGSAKPAARKATAKPTRKSAKSAGTQVGKARTTKAAKQAKTSMPKAPKAAARPARVTGHKTAGGAGARKAPPVRPPVEAYRGAKPYIFASYSHQNMREVFSVIKKLNGSRYRIWYDEGVEPGNEWPEEVGRALLGCSQFIVFMSRSAADSRNVRNEINLASGEDKNVLVVFLEPTDLSEGMRLQIGTVQFLNRFQMTEKEFLDKLKKVLSNDLKN